MKKLILSIAIMLICGTVMAQNAKLPENISLKTLDGKTVTSAVLQNDGKPFVISFWATWCKPCNVELNTIRELYEEWQEETGIKIVAVSIDDSRSASKVKPHVDGNGWEYEVYLDQNRDLARAMNVGADVPYTFIINGEGEIVWMHKGYQPGGEDELIEQYRKILKGE
ncbi:MAG: TlpA family protein disulfide reductase [Bacteroidales bacterium]|nr:TlpA family protein disulfide reductase [Bacteroidales bacterium]